jgi:hypothetical protein
MGICEAYNIGGSKAQYPYLIFCHEDIIFLTSNWGILLCQNFEQDLQIGLIGVIGGKYKSVFKSGWGIPANNTTSSFMIGSHFNKSNLSIKKNNTSSSIPFINLANVPKDFI